PVGAHHLLARTLQVTCCRSTLASTRTALVGLLLSENPADDFVCIHVEAAPMTEQDAARPPCVKFRDGRSCLFPLQHQRQAHPEEHCPRG
ncbi:hypothetical protein, partial [Variovorax sp. MHTC-1]|uniref:hypothetical protein n=1 Tax=Variovorax sp. MHTC-1 TaxID=2495593 RepID=UPI001C8EBA82